MSKFNRGIGHVWNQNTSYTRINMNGESTVKSFCELMNWYAIYGTVEPYAQEFNPISEILEVLKINTKPINIALICNYSTTKLDDENSMNAFYKELIQTYDKLLWNSIKMALGDLNAKCGRERQFSPIIKGKYIWYE